MDTAATGAFSPAYRWYTLTLLVVVYVFNFIDRSILGILVQPTKEDLGVSDILQSVSFLAHRNSCPTPRVGFFTANRRITEKSVGFFYSKSPDN